MIFSNGLDAIISDRHYHFLYQLLSQSFHDVDAGEIMGSMLFMRQYFLFKRDRPVAVVSVRDRGFLQCAGKYYNNVLYNVSTASSYRGKGCMKKLLRHIIRDYRKQKKRHLNLEVYKDNTPAVSLYKKLGFRIVHECDGIYMMRICLQQKKSHG